MFHSEIFEIYVLKNSLKKIKNKKKRKRKGKILIGKKCFRGFNYYKMKAEGTIYVLYVPTTEKGSPEA